MKYHTENRENVSATDANAKIGYWVKKEMSFSGIDDGIYPIDDCKV